jgi:hypothetical protein
MPLVGGQDEEPSCTIKTSVSAASAKVIATATF